MIAFEARACSVLYNLLLSLEDERPFLLPANVCPVVPATFRQAGRPFELVDIDAGDLCLSRDLCLARISADRPGFAGVLYVRSYGVENDPEPFFQALAELRPDLLVIDDKCLCRPDCDGERLSPRADVTLFSTGYAKHVDLGVGGFAHLREGVPYRRHRDRPPEGEDWLDLSPPALSWEAYRETVLAALREADGHKRRLNAAYAGALPPEIQLPSRFQGWRFNLAVPEPDALVERLFAAGLFASRHYPPLEEEPGEGSFPAAERLHRRIVNLFNDRYFDEEQARRATGVVLEHLWERTRESPPGLPLG